MEKGKQFRESAAAGIKIKISDLLDELSQADVDKAVEWSGREIVADPAIGVALSDLLLGNHEITRVVLGISAQSGMAPPNVHNTLASGFIMGIAVVLELLNKRESVDENEEIFPENETIQ